MQLNSLPHVAVLGFLGNTLIIIAFSAVLTMLESLCNLTKLLLET